MRKKRKKIVKKSKSESYEKLNFNDYWSERERKVIVSAILAESGPNSLEK